MLTPSELDSLKAERERIARESLAIWKRAERQARKQAA
jgi:hypothetical protein